jgi:hypothetical protein
MCSVGAIAGGRKAFHLAAEMRGALVVHDEVELTGSTSVL